MKFAVLQWLLAAALVLPVCIALFWFGTRRRRQSLDRIVAPRLHEILVRSVDHRKRILRAVLFVFAVGLLLASLARPLWGLKEVQVERAGVDVLVALDVSRSMLAEDAPPPTALAPPARRSRGSWNALRATATA